MKYKKLASIVLLTAVFMSGCKQHQEARRPLSQSSGSFMKKSIARNKKLIKGEEAQIDSLIKSNPAVKYVASSKGYWYAYEKQNLLDSINPKKGDVAFFNYEIKNIHGAVIYSEAELGSQTYYVDKQNIMMGLRDGIKLMRKSEKIKFLFPSHMGYGYHGDNKKIGTNQPLICTVTLHDFKSEADLRKEAAAALEEQQTMADEETPVSKPQTTAKKPIDTVTP